jgi:hypothetical protein
MTQNKLNELFLRFIVDNLHEFIDYQIIDKSPIKRLNEHKAVDPKEGKLKHYYNLFKRHKQERGGLDLAESESWLIPKNALDKEYLAEQQRQLIKKHNLPVKPLDW